MVGEIIKSSSIPIGSFKAKHAGEPCALLGNGPSIGQHDLSLLQCVTFGINRSWELYWPTYHVIADHAQYMRYATDWKKLKGACRLAGRQIAEDFYATMGRQGRLFTVGSNPIPDAIRLGFHRKSLTKGRTPDPFSLDMEEGVVMGIANIGSATYVALQLAVYMGCDPVFLLGVDLQGEHFHGDWAPNPEALRQQNGLFHWAKRVLDEKNGGRPKVYVVGSPGSLCDAWPKIGYAEALKMQGNHSLLT